MELSNDKLIATQDRGTRRALAPDMSFLLEKTYGMNALESRGFKRQTISRFLGACSHQTNSRVSETYSFTNEETGEGFVAQRVAGNNYRIKGHWVPGEEEVIQPGYVFGGHRADYVRVVNPSQRPQLKVYCSQDTAAS